MFISGGSGGRAVLKSGSLTGITQAAKKQISFAAYPNFKNFELVMKNLVSSAALAAGADIMFELTVAGVAQSTAYGRFVKAGFAGFTFADTSVQLYSNPGIDTLVNGGGVLRFYNMNINKRPFGEFETFSGGAAREGGTYNWVREAAAVHDGVSFGVLAADADTQSFDYELIGLAG